jgi:RNA-splicing ligase RtcB
MIELKGKFNKDCKIFIDDVEEQAISTIYSILNDKVSEGVPVRIMPDVHEGKGIVIGFTMPLTDRINPNHVGVDIGCGVAVAKLPKLELSLEEIDRRIKATIPMGFSHCDKAYDLSKIAFNAYDYEEAVVDIARTIGLDFGDVARQVGTLGGGNHFIEIGESNGEFYLFVHSGSRNFGLQICNYHFKKTKEGTASQYLFGDDMHEYLVHMDIAQKFAALNRSIMIENICKAIYKKPWKIDTWVDTVHNYIDLQYEIIRKGAVSAREDELLVIPMNMRDGVLVCRGKGNPDWNCSAPHGAGRILSRSKAKQTVTLEEFEASMQGICSSSVNKSTLDESPMVYKDMDVIKAAIEPTVDILKTIKPILNIKSSE